MTAPPVLLLVEDHDLVLEFLQCMFLEAGNDVVGINDGVAALTALRTDIDGFSAVMADIQLGSRGPGGWDVGQQARSLAPRLPIVYLTGNDMHDWLARSVAKSALVSKPFRSDYLIQVVANELVEATRSCVRAQQATILPGVGVRNGSMARHSLPQALAGRGRVGT